MADYRKMYLHLFNEVTRAVNILAEAQEAVEGMYMEAEETPLRFPGKDAKLPPHLPNT